MKKFLTALLCLVLSISSITLTGFTTSPPVEAAGLAATPAESISKVWERTDKPVNDGRISRTWMWGPTGQYGDNGFDVQYEPYAQSPDGKRMVFYFDKSRMEITQPFSDPNSKWYVTNGLLTKELITGQMQFGDSQFEGRSPANIPVAGDADDPNGPTYATFGNVLAGAGQRSGGIIDTIDRSGNVGQNGSLGEYTSYAYFVRETGHNIPQVFWDFLNSTGVVYENGSFRQGRLFDPTFFATGYPITEPYWSQVKVGGQTKWVLIQCFERRVLTFTPSNSDGWKVEMGNIGLHYYTWRYSGAGQSAQTPGGTQENGDPFADVPAAVSASIMPKGGPAGTIYSVSFWGLAPYEEFDGWFNAPNGTVIGIGDSFSHYKSDYSGYARNMPLPSDNMIPGVWSLVVHGISSGHESVIYFKVTRPGEVLPDLYPDVPAGISGSILPKGGPVNSYFRVDVWGFRPNMEVGYWVNSPSGAAVGGVNHLQTDASGRISGLRLSTAKLWPGMWSLVVREVKGPSKSVGPHESVVFFRITE